MRDQLTIKTSTYNVFQAEKPPADDQTTRRCGSRSLPCTTEYWGQERQVIPGQVEPRLQLRDFRARNRQISQRISLNWTRMGQIPECRGCGHSYENSPFWDDSLSGNCEEGKYLSSSLIEGEWDGEVWMIDFGEASYTYNTNYETLPRDACIRCVRDYSGT